MTLVRTTTSSLYYRGRDDDRRRRDDRRKPDPRADGRYEGRYDRRFDDRVCSDSSSVLKKGLVASYMDWLARAVQSFSHDVCSAELQPWCMQCRVLAMMYAVQSSSHDVCSAELQPWCMQCRVTAMMYASETWNLSKKRKTKFEQHKWQWREKCWMWDGKKNEQTLHFEKRWDYPTFSWE